ncbi:AraC family transcriptional regulator [Paenibacillus sp. N3.4]|uniref:helix-turn-helix domain-containing protein n=1 Tax=Paenibacillus sp. N3.4 TaxID=2603222 RepID=UPI0011CCAC42|nr:AraC family transcriptional regulator [Paenibacillus sp. N3.4]TXK68951.1 helix-turn-helix transcriptional regulator [Paenibacillus sp. N3.4]
MPDDKVEVVLYTYAGPQPGFLLPEDTYDSSAVLCVEFGSFEFEIGNESGHAAMGDIVFCPPGVLFKRKSPGEIAFHMILFNLFTQGEPSLLKPQSAKNSISDLVRLSSTYTYLRKLQHQPGATRPITSMTNHLVKDLLFLCQQERAATEIYKKPTDPLMQQAVGYIYRNVFSEISMQEIANRLGIKQPQLTRRFQAAYGVVPVEFVTRLRLEEAKKLLLQTDDTLETIALRCGYENGSYLSRIFSTKIGTSPSLFRKNYRV